MKKSFVSLLTIAAITFGMVSCNSSKKQDAAEQKVEEEAVIAGEVSKGLLTAELKDEVTRFLKDMPDSGCLTKYLPARLRSLSLILILCCRSARFPN